MYSSELIIIAIRRTDRVACSIPKTEIKFSQMFANVRMSNLNSTYKRRLRLNDANLLISNKFLFLLLGQKLIFSASTVYGLNTEIFISCDPDRRQIAQ